MKKLVVGLFCLFFGFLFAEEYRAFTGFDFNIDLPANRIIQTYIDNGYKVENDGYSYTITKDGAKFLDWEITSIMIYVDPNTNKVITEMIMLNPMFEDYSVIFKILKLFNNYSKALFYMRETDDGYFHNKFYTYSNNREIQLYTTSTSDHDLYSIAFLWSNYN